MTAAMEVGVGVYLGLLAMGLAWWAVLRLVRRRGTR